MRVALVALWAVIGLAACSWMQPIQPTPDSRRHVKVALTAYSATQQAMIIYGQLPGCDAAAGVVRFCRDQAAWNKIKIADKLAVNAITAAAPVLAGEDQDDGQIIKALIAIEQVTAALSEAERKWRANP